MNQDVLSQIDVADGYGESLYTRVVKAGHRTYFIDLKATRSKDYFISLTELRKKNTPNGVVTERNKVFIFNEDIEKISESLNDVIAKIAEFSK
ncbi:MAG: DUF3276 family protein [Alistipes sp.]|nr:DUF3276 family protein [Alistipes sp.]MDO5497626.1 DUF3276 family protein [Alistipes sp.]